MKEIVLIAPYERLFEMANRVALEHGYQNVTVVLGDLESGVEQARLAVEQGADLVISRGGTYRLLKKELSVPVVELQISAYDIMKSIKHVIGQDAPVGIIGFHNIIYGYDLLSDLKGISIHKIDLGLGENIREKIEECAENGIRIFVGDAIVHTICERLGYPCFMIESGEESVASAMDKAESILLAARKELERSKRLLTLIDCVHDGVVATDEDNRVLAYNTVAQGILGVRREQVIGQKLADLAFIGEIGQEMLAGRTVTDELRSFQDTKITLSNVAIEVGGKSKGSVAVFQEVSRLQNLEQKIRKKLMEHGFYAKYTFDAIIHQSDAMNKAIELSEKFSRYNASVLIFGGSGVGKELFAQSIHNAGRRRNGPFVAINCAALPSSIIESELFGYVEGAFTGSKKGGKAGVFELAHGGTIFLDEISELPIDVQGRLLRVIQEREVMRLGDDKVIPLDIRIICATNRDLKRMVAEGQFRQDLLYRINILSFTIPGLSERKEDILLLAEHFLMRYSRRYDKEIVGISPRAADYLTHYQYLGNVRELQGMIERAVIICDTTLLRLSDFTDAVESGVQEQTETGQTQDAAFWRTMATLPALRDLEEQYIQHVYSKMGNSVSKTCRVLKIDRSTLWRKLKGQKE